MSNREPQSSVIRFAELTGARIHKFEIIPDADARAALAQEFGINGIKKLRFTGEIAPLGKKDWQLAAALGATIVQSCIVTLDPVTTRVDEKILRTYLETLPELPDGEEVEMLEDENQELLPETLDINAVMAEALALHIPLYPRAEGAALGSQTFSEPGVEALDDEKVKPFASLAALKAKMEQNEK